MGLSILIVDDDFINRKLLSTMLKKNSIVENIVEAENGQDAIEKLQSNDKIDLILLDIIMPIMDGVEFLKNIRQNRFYANIPIAILSTDDSKKSETLNHGGNAFLTKPIRETELFALIDSWF